MKTKIVLFSILTAACILVFTSATWADGRKDRGHGNPKQKQYTTAQHHKQDYRQNQGKNTNRYQDRKPQPHKHSDHRAKYHRLGSHDRNYRHNSYYRHHGKQRPYFKPRHFIKRPVQKKRPPRLHRPIYSRTDGNVSILASTSNHGWLIKIFSRD
jgi:hypothetical protein